jgi:hypothetical protein
LWSGKLIQSGSGTDCHRTFTLQAEFFNHRGATPVQKPPSTTLTACLAEQLNLLPSNPSAEKNPKTRNKNTNKHAHDN